MTSVQVMRKSKVQREENHYLFSLGMVLMIASIFARNILHLSIPVAVILAIGACVALVSTRNEMIVLAVCCIPMSSAFQYKYLIFICIVVYAVKYGKDIKISASLVPLILMMVWELLHGLFFPFSLVEYFRGFSELIFCTFLMMVAPSKINYKMVSRWLAISSICMMSIVLLNLLDKTGYNFTAIFEGAYRFGVGNVDAENFGVNYNANGLGLIANLSIAGLLQLIASKKHHLIDYLMVMILTVFGVMTMSRAFLVCFVLIFVMFALSGVSTLSAKIKRICLIAVRLTMLWLFVYTLMPTVYATFVARFHVDDISNGRNDLFIFYAQHILSGPLYILFGVGRQNYGEIVNKIHQTSWDVCHNGAQELVVCWGLLGLVLFVWFVVRMIYSRPQGMKCSIVNFIPLVLILVSVQAGQLITSGFALLSLCFAYISLCHDFSGGSENEKTVQSN